MDQWSPKPLRPLSNLPTNKGIIIEKSVSPIERQRQKDGTQHSFNRMGSLKPADPILVIKGSLAENLPEPPAPVQADPPVYDLSYATEVVKAFLNS